MKMYLETLERWYLLSRYYKRKHFRQNLLIYLEILNIIYKEI